jgi:hypothetical protein
MPAVLFERALRRKHVVCMIAHCDKLPTWYIMAPTQTPEGVDATAAIQGRPVPATIQFLELHAYACDDHQHTVTDELRERGVKYLLRPYRPWMPRWVLQVLIAVAMLLIAGPVILLMLLKAVRARIRP